jgi:hypothetical protein
VSDPAAPVLMSSLDVDAAGTAGVVVDGYYAYVVGGYLTTVRVANPIRPVQVAQLDLGTGLCPDGMALSGDHMYLSADRLYVLSLVDPAHPDTVGYYSASWQIPQGLAVAGDLAYVACGDMGLRVFRYYGSGIEETPSAELRPATTPTIVRGLLFLPVAPSDVQVADLLDASGRSVTLLQRGANDVSKLSPGVYFVRAVSREPSAVSCYKVIIAR